jgi:hypothetical protein
MKSIFAIVAVLGMVSCAQGHCRRSKDTPKVSVPEGADAAAATKTDAKGEHIFVYKYDGSQQCKKAKGLSVEAMQKTLKDIPVFSATKKSDGQMHIQVCGSITGMANVYEIHSEDAKKAESLGFKRWNFAD